MWPFNRKQQSAPEQKSLADPSEDLFALFGAAVPGTVAVPAHVALTVPAVAASIRVISEAAATLDIRVVEGDQVVSHPIADLLKGDINGWTSGFELIRDLTAEALTRDTGGTAWVNRIGGEVREILHYAPSVIMVDHNTDTREPTYKMGGRTLPPHDVIHLRGPFNRCPLTLAREAIGAAHVMAEHAARLFKNGARPGGVLESPKPVGDDGVKKMIKGWRAAHDGPENAGKTAVLWDGTVFKPLALSSVDAQFLELRRFQLEEIARAFNLPSTMIGDLTRATWSNLESKNREFLSYSLEPWLRSLEAALTRSLLSAEERATLRIAFDRDDLTRVALTERATAISSLRTSETITANEGRSWLDLPAMSGGDILKNPNTKPANDNQPTEAAA